MAITELPAYHETQPATEGEFPYYSSSTLGEMLVAVRDGNESGLDVSARVDQYISDLVGSPIAYSRVIRDAFQLDEAGPETLTMVTAEPVAAPTIRFFKTAAWIHYLQEQGYPVRYIPRQWTFDTYVGSHKDYEGIKPSYIMPTVISGNGNGREPIRQVHLAGDPESHEGRMLRSIQTENITDRDFLDIIDAHPGLFPNGHAMPIPDFHKNLLLSTGLVDHIPDRAEYDIEVIAAMFLGEKPVGKIRDASFVRINNEGQMEGYVRYRHLYDELAPAMQELTTAGDTEGIKSLLSTIRPNAELYYSHIPYYSAGYCIKGIANVETYIGDDAIMPKVRSGIDKLIQHVGKKPTIIEETWLFGCDTNSRVRSTTVPIELVKDPQKRADYLAFVSENIDDQVVKHGCSVEDMKPSELDYLSMQATVAYVLSDLYTR